MPFRPLKTALTALCGMVIAGWVSVPEVRGAGFSLTALASFNGSEGASPYAGLLEGPDGNLYGTTFQGGASGLGAVYRVTPAGILSNLTSFNGANGSRPYAGLIEGSDGNLYGTTSQGGISNLGTIFRITTNGTLTTLVSFVRTNGASPAGRLLLHANGNFYGTTLYGGANNQGTVFRMTSNGVLDTLFSFGSTNGANPYAKLFQAADGGLYGTTLNGGVSGSWGTIFRITTNGALNVLFSFAGTNGASPYAGLIQDANGILFGTATYGGIGFDGSIQSGNGTVFQITTNGTFQLLYSFLGGNDGYNPRATLVQGVDDNFYGTTVLGGTNGYGTVFQFLADGTLNSLISFNFDDNGAQPYGGLIVGPHGSFYGTTWGAGTSGKGTVYRIDPAGPSLHASRSGDTITLGWNALPDQIFQVQYSTGLTLNNWTNLGGLVIATNTSVTVLDAVGPATRKFYRLILQLPP